MSEIYCRVDGRLIHGQTAIAWTKILAIEAIMVVNNDVIKDDMQKMLLEMATPVGVELSIKTVEEAKKVLENGIKKSTLIIFKYIQDVVQLVDLGGKIEDLNVGGVYHEVGKKEYAKALCLNQQDIDDLQSLLQKGIDVFYQVNPMNSKESIIKYIS